MFARILSALHDVVLAARELGIVEIEDAILRDPLVGPSLLIPGRGVTRDDIEGRVKLFRECGVTGQNLMQFNEEHFRRVASRVAAKLSKYPDLQELHERLVEVLEAGRQRAE